MDYFPNLGNGTALSSNEFQPTNVSITEEVRVIIFPNPTTGLVTVKLVGEICKMPFNLRILDALGTELEYRENVEGNTIVDLSNYSKGVYFFVVETGSKRLFNRLSKL